MNRIVARTLACGMPLVVEEMPALRSCALCWLVPAGSSRDPDEQEGISTLAAELIMRGCGTRTSREHADAVDELGASRSAEVGGYFIRIASTMLGSRVHDVLPLIADMVRSPRFDEDALGPARDLALQALESVADDPQERAGLAAKARHYPAPLHRSGLGTESGLNAVTADGLHAWWASLARPRGSILAIAGAVDADALSTTLDRLLTGWDGGVPDVALGPTPARGYEHLADASNQVQIIVQGDAPRERDADAPLERVVVNVLSGGMSGRLFTEVREKRGLCYSVNAGFASDRDFGTFSAYVGTTPERAQESLDALSGELSRILSPEGRVTADEFERALTGAKSRLIFAGESTGARAGALAADMHRLGRPRGLEELRQQLDAITLDAVNAYLARRRLGSLTIQTLGPSPLVPPKG